MAINKLAAKFYSHLLTSHPVGEKARAYLLKRAIKKRTWEQFFLGYAPFGWENILTFLTKRGYQLPDVATCGLIIARSAGRVAQQQGYYDRFRDRIVFPLKDARGQILGFSARVISDKKDEPKYINSPQTPIFNKGSVLFGLDIARESIKKKNEAVLVEGEFDVLSASQIGVENIVASKGTALTDKQVAMLSRLCENVSLCFDTDIAGDVASRRGIELLDLAGINVKVVELEKYKDPDEFARAAPRKFKEALSNASNIYDYLVESVAKRFDPKTAVGKKKIGQEVIPTLSKISDDLVRAHYIEKLAKVLELEIPFVAAAVEKNLGKLSKETEDTDLTTSGESFKSTTKVEEYFLALVLSQEEVLANIFSQVSPADFEGENARDLWKWLRDIIRNSKIKNIKKLLVKLPKNLSDFVDNLYLINISPIFSERELWAQELAKMERRMKQAALRRQLIAITNELKIAQKNKDSHKISLLTKKFDETSKLLKEIFEYE